MDIVSEISALRTIYGSPRDLVAKKALTKLERHGKAFIALSPFLLISSHGPGGADISPRGDPPGFVKVVDDETLLIPDRPGNNRIDTMENICRNSVVGVIFLVPGLGEVLRVNGNADIVIGEGLECLAQNDRVPKAAIRVHIVETFFHCAKAILRSKLWEPETRIPKTDFPPLGVILADQVAGADAGEGGCHDRERVQDDALLGSVQNDPATAIGRRAPPSTRSSRLADQTTPTRKHARLRARQIARSSRLEKRRVGSLELESRSSRCGSNSVDHHCRPASNCKRLVMTGAGLRRWLGHAWRVFGTQLSRDL